MRLLSIVFILICFNITAKAQTNKPMTQKLLRHIVLFKFKDTSSQAGIKSVEKAFLALPSKIKEIKSLEWGLNSSPEHINQGFTHCFYATFASDADRDTYLKHPDHKAFGKVLGPYLDKVLVFDYWTQ
jgi:hypothetical protein